MTTPTAPAPTLAADSVGTVETRYLELPDPSTRPAALSYFDLARQYGGGSRTRAFEDGFGADAADRRGIGHDYFLLEERRQTPIIDRLLGEGP
jgi:hypothetical protein